MSDGTKAEERGPIVVKIGGSTLGDEDTTLEDVVALRKRGERVIVVHGGGAMISDWLERLEVSSVFIDGLRLHERRCPGRGDRGAARGGEHALRRGD